MNDEQSQQKIAGLEQTVQALTQRVWRLEQAVTESRSTRAVQRLPGRLRLRSGPADSGADAGRDRPGARAGDAAVAPAATAAEAAVRLGQARRAALRGPHAGLGRRRRHGARDRAALRDGREPRLDRRPGCVWASARPARSPCSAPRSARPALVALGRDPVRRRRRDRRALRKSCGPPRRSTTWWRPRPPRRSPG